MSKTTVTLNATVVSNVAMHGRTVRLAADGFSIGLGAAAGLAAAKALGLRLAAAAAEVAALAPIVVTAAPIVAGVAVGIGATFSASWGIDKIFGRTTVVSEEELTRASSETPETPAAAEATTATTA